ncbi:hypothetical protein, partial [Sutterella wadsworthensis]|uniref:hypothetical protein n=1 Tax=Sutterella wadsworthensis TaxID=40545 RepID=UPI002666A8C3
CGLWQMLSRIGAGQKERFGFVSRFNSSCKADAKDCRPFILYLMKSAPLKYSRVRFIFWNGEDLASLLKQFFY